MNELMDNVMGGMFPQMGGGGGYLRPLQAGEVGQNVGSNRGFSPDGVSRPYTPIVDDADAMMRMQTGEFDDLGSMSEEAQKDFMAYINKPKSHITSQQIGAQGLSQAGQLGMSGLKDMSQFAQATPMQGLMSQATAGIPQRGKQPFQMAQGLMNPWGG